ncbi:L-serine ammonia-lyase, iron-sulfur-dependent, subunit alpha [uncultured Fusobacterium sp.]|uniref:L-cysteine desulfidase family protein n=1 Tax=uncultured Fusobacterium sp. TaxID=159267 RepID=UPI0025D28EDD|nr:L-serine ammonia-lyase, iron-sulfur-dependent, subunit alpha [uncultured Fusobacterium sp.]
MHILTKIIKEDMKPALGVTEPGAIAFAVAKAKSYIQGNIEEVKVRLNSGIYKNAYTCGIPNSDQVGNIFAAALGVVAGKADRGLESLEDVTEEDNKKAQKLIDAGKVKIELNKISSDIFIETEISALEEKAIVKIEGTHTNIVEIVVNGKTIFTKELEKEENKDEEIILHKYSVKDILEYVDNVDIAEIDFVMSAHDMNMFLFQEGLNSKKTTFVKQLWKINGEKIFSESSLNTAQLLCNGAIEARVLGLNKPAMSITGSGAHGIITTLPVLAECRVKGLNDEKLIRATMLSYLICTYIKEYSGRLSAFCGCGIAGGTGAACAIGYLRGAGVEEITNIINNMAAGITGMICDGGNQGCTMKGIVAVDAAFRAVEMAMNNTYIFNIHGINGVTPEKTMMNMGKIASPGMIETEKVIVDIFKDK